MLTKDQIVTTLRESIGAALREKHGKGKVLVPSGTLEQLIAELANNAAAPLVLELDITMQSALENRLELESLHARLTQAGGRGATLDVMLSGVLESARTAYRAQLELRRVVAAADKFVELVDEPGVGGCPVCNLPAEEGYKPLIDAIGSARGGSVIEPSKRIAIYPDRTFTRPRDVEILVLGEPMAIAPLVADLRTTLERWEGFEAVMPIVMGEQMIGFRASRSKWAFHDDPVAEALRLFSSPLVAQYRVEWFGIATGAADSALGAVGSW